MTRGLKRVSRFAWKQFGPVHRDHMINPRSEFGLGQASEQLSCSIK
jgi:hypothetical protein